MMNLSKLLRSVPFWMVTIVATAIVVLSAHRLEQRSQARARAPVQALIVRVRAVPVVRGNIEDWVYGSGILRATRREFLNFRQSGRVVFIDADPDGQQLREGSRVRGPAEGEKYGQLLARIDRREHIAGLQAQEASWAQSRQGSESAKLQILQAQSELRLAQNNFERSSALLAENVVSQEAFEQTQTALQNAKLQLKASKSNQRSMAAQSSGALARVNQAKLALERSSVFAAFDGVIAHLNIREGQYVSPGTMDTSSEEARTANSAIVLIADDSFEITLNLPSFDGRLVQREQAAFITWGQASLNVGAQPPLDSVVPAYVYAVSPSIRPSGRSIETKVRTLNADAASNLKDGMFATCWILVEERKDVLLLPLNALNYRQNEPFVLVFDAETQTVEERALVVGVEDLKQVQILSGLEEGTLVVTEGRQRLGPGSRARLISATEGQEQ